MPRSWQIRTASVSESGPATPTRIWNEERVLKHNTDRILTSHAGNLPRPDKLNDILASGGGGTKAYTDLLPAAIAEVVDRQIECGVDVVNDGEYIKAGSYSGYIHERVTGWETKPIDPAKPPKRAGVAE